MSIATDARQILFDGVVLTPGETFVPFAELPDYEVTFAGILDGRIHLITPTNTYSCPLADIADFESE